MKEVEKNILNRLMQYNNNGHNNRFNKIVPYPEVSNYCYKEYLHN